MSVHCAGGTLGNHPEPAPSISFGKLQNAFQEFPQGLPKASESFQEFQFSSPENRDLPMTYGDSRFLPADFVVAEASGLPLQNALRPRRSDQCRRPPLARPLLVHAFPRSPSHCWSMAGCLQWHRFCPQGSICSHFVLPWLICRGGPSRHRHPRSPGTPLGLDFGFGRSPRLQASPSERPLPARFRAFSDRL